MAAKKDVRDAAKKAKEAAKRARDAALKVKAARELAEKVAADAKKA
jgi:hypothetical protein